MIKLPIKTPKLPAELAPAKLVGIIGSDRVELSHFQDQILEADSSRALVLDQVRITSCSFETCEWPKLQLSDSVLSACSVIGCRWSEAGVVRCRFEKSRLSGLDLNGASLQDVVFVGCKLDLANLRMSKLVRCEFHDCDLSAIDFYGAQLDQVTITGCNLANAQFSNCKAAALDLRGSDLTGLNGLLSLKGATISSLQALVLGPKVLKELGIHIEDQ